MRVVEICSFCISLMVIGIGGVLTSAAQDNSFNDNHDHG